MCENGLSAAAVGGRAPCPAILRHGGTALDDGVHPLHRRHGLAGGQRVTGSVPAVSDRSSTGVCIPRVGRGYASPLLGIRDCAIDRLRAIEPVPRLRCTTRRNRGQAGGTMSPYTCNVTDLQETGGRYRVSATGQFSLPASARRRWGIEGGGDVEVFDLGEAVVIFPGGPGTARRALAEALDADRYEQLIARIHDPDLRDE
jgi:bifunctional DNA-binding transcriptional regulator/antitoxin component of YhaV-PrlF toxin-antitoxin module